MNDLNPDTGMRSSRRKVNFNSASGSSFSSGSGSSDSGFTFVAFLVIAAVLAVVIGVIYVFYFVGIKWSLMVLGGLAVTFLLWIRHKRR